MKIKKSELERIIENYLFERDDWTMSPVKKTVNIKRVELEKRRWPQDYVIFEDAFNQHVKNWQLFSRTHPIASTILQMLDITGVSSYGDLATSIEKVNTETPTKFDKLMFWLNIFSSLPVGMITGMFAGRLATTGINALIDMGNASGAIGKLKALGNATSNYADLGAKTVKGLQKVFNAEFFSWFRRYADEIAQGVKPVLKETSEIIAERFMFYLDEMVKVGKITQKTADEIVTFFSKYYNSPTGAYDVLIDFLTALDSLPWRAFEKTIIHITEQIGESMGEHILQFYINHPDIANEHTVTGMDMLESIVGENGIDILDTMYDLVFDNDYVNAVDEFIFGTSPAATAN